MEVIYLTGSYEQGVAPPRLFLSEIFKHLKPFSFDACYFSVFGPAHSMSIKSLAQWLPTGICPAVLFNVAPGDDGHCILMLDI